MFKKTFITLIILLGGLWSISHAQQGSASASMRISARVMESSTVSHNLPSQVNVTISETAKRAGTIRVEGSENFKVLINLSNRVELMNKNNESLFLDISQYDDNSSAEKELFYNIKKSEDRKAASGVYSGNLLATIEYI